MFVLLEHDTSAHGRRSTVVAVHWDLIVEIPGETLLPTWRLASNPLVVLTGIPAERIPDHRPHFLSYEGALSGTRGTVRRLDRGPAMVLHFEGDEIRIVTDGTRLRGSFEITAVDGACVFRRDRGGAVDEARSL